MKIQIAKERVKEKTEGLCEASKALGWGKGGLWEHHTLIRK